MIAIINVSRQLKNKGWQDYAVKINSVEVCRFKHRREESLLKCLRLAADAVEEKEMKYTKLFEQFLQSIESK